MASVRITCPHCGLAKDVPEGRIPDGSVRISCPRCQQGFVFSKAAVTPAGPVLQPTAGAGGALPTIGSLFETTWSIYTRRIGVLLCLTLLALLPYLALAAIIPPLRSFFTLSDVMVSVLGVSGLLASIVLSFWGAVAAMCAVLDDGLTIRGAMQRGWQKLGSFIWLSLVQAFIVVGASLLFIVPGLYLTVCFIFAQLILLNEGERGLNALLKSKEYLKGHFLPVFCRLVPIWIIPAVIGFFPLAGGILSLLCAPFAMIYTRLLYQELGSIRKDMTFVAHTQYKWLWIGASGYFVFPFLVIFVVMPGISPISPLRALFQDKPTGEPAAAATAFVKLHNTMFRQAGLAWDVKPVSMTAEQYDTLLVTQKVDFEQGKKVSVGPAAFQYGGFFDLGAAPSIQLLIRLVQLPNIDLDSGKCVRVVIRHVWDRENGDIYDPAGNSEFGQQVKMLIKEALPNPFIRKHAEHPSPGTRQGKQHRGH